MMAVEMEEMLPEAALREAEVSAGALEHIEKYARERQASLSRRGVDASAARNALTREPTVDASQESAGAPSSTMLWGAALSSSSSSSHKDETSRGHRRNRESEETVWRGIRALEALEAVEELHCSRLSASYESLRLAVKVEAAEASSSISENAEKLSKAVSACRRAEAVVRRCRASLAKAKDAATQSETERAESARLANEATAKAVRDIEALSRSRYTDQRSSSSSSSGSKPAELSAKKASAAAERARSLERRRAERVREAYGRVGKETTELRSAADVALKAIREKEKCELAVTENAVKIKTEFAGPRALDALREIVRYERGHLEAQMARLDDLDRILLEEDGHAHPRTIVKTEEEDRPDESSHSRHLVGRSLELLRECLVNDYYSKQSDEERGDEDLIDAHVSSFFASAACSEPSLSLRDDGENGELPPLPSFRESGEPRHAASALLDFVDESRDRAAAVARSMNRQRSKQTAAASLESLDALAALSTHVVRVCCAHGDAHTPGVVLMLTQTFFFVTNDEDEGRREEQRQRHEEDDEQRERQTRTRRIYLKDRLDDDFQLRYDEKLWRICLKEAALSAVASTTVHYRPYWDVVFTSDENEVAADVHRCVHAQLAAFLFAMKDLGAPKAQVRNFAVSMSNEYQLPSVDRLDLVAPYEYEEGEESPSSRDHSSSRLATTPKSPHPPAEDDSSDREEREPAVLATSIV